MAKELVTMSREEIDRLDVIRRGRAKTSPRLTFFS
jgi:hypothetical protein